MLENNSEKWPFVVAATQCSSYAHLKLQSKHRGLSDWPVVSYDTQLICIERSRNRGLTFLRLGIQDKLIS